MYSVSKKKRRKKFFVNSEDVICLDGFMMGSKNKIFNIGGVSISNIKIVDRSLARPLVSKKVFSKFNKLISLLTDLLISDDDTGDTFREALNQIEKFRLEIKNKYRVFLEQKELELMSKKLKLLKKTAEVKLIEFNNANEMLRSNGKGK
mgnify:FL=1